MTQDDLLDVPTISGEGLNLTSKGLNDIVVIAKAIEREEICLLLKDYGLEMNSTTRNTIDKLVELIRCRQNN